MYKNSAFSVNDEFWKKLNNVVKQSDKIKG